MAEKDKAAAARWPDENTSIPEHKDLVRIMKQAVSTSEE